MVFGGVAFGGVVLTAVSDWRGLAAAVAGGATEASGRGTRCVVFAWLVPAVRAKDPLLLTRSRQDVRDAPRCCQGTYSGTTRGLAAPRSASLASSAAMDVASIAPILW